MNEQNNIFKLNNRAIACLQQGNRRMAISTLREALVSSRRRVQNCEEIKRSHTHPHEHGNMPKDKIPVFSIPFTERLPCHEEQDNNVNVFAFFNRAFVFSQNDLESQSQLSLEEQNRALAILLYNLGVLHHSEAVLYHHDSITKFAEALKFYKLVLSIFEATESDPFEDQGMAYILIATCNNMGHINSHFFRQPETRQCLAWVQELLLSSNIFACADDDEYFLSILFVPQSTCLCSPVA